MKNNALFVNVGRGSVIDEGALVGALLQSRIAGTVLDITNIEPIPRKAPLWACPTVILTQHTAGGYKGENMDKARVFIDNLRRYRSKEPLLNLVDLERGY